MADTVYYNLTIGNNDPGTAGDMSYSAIPATIDALNNIPIIENPQDYYCSLIRFQIPCQNLPLIEFLVQTPVLDINKGIYSFTISNGSENPTQEFVMFEPQVLNLPPNQIPPLGTPLQTFTEYYLLYDYTWFIKLLNTALAACASAVSISAPFFVYDAPTQLITLYADKASFGTGGTYKLWFNNALLNYFVGLESNNYSTTNSAPHGMDNLVGIRDNMLNTVSPTTSGIAYLTTSFQYSSYGYWNFLKSILITTTMNVNSEAVYSNNNSLYQNVQYANILTDFMPDLAQNMGAGIQNQIFTYNAPSLYRIFSFNQKTPLYRINLSVNLVDTYGNIFPLTLPKGQLCNFKLMFIKKDIYAARGNFLH